MRHTHVHHQNLVVNTNALITYRKQSKQISVKACRPSIKGSKLPLKVIKAIVIIHVNASHTCASPNLVVNTNALITYPQTVEADVREGV